MILVFTPMSFFVNSFTYVNMYVCMYEHKINSFVVSLYACMYVCVYTELSYLSNIAQELLSPMRSYEVMQNMIDEDFSLLLMSGTYIHTYIHAHSS
jgi:hypothetical protein